MTEADALFQRGTGLVKICGLREPAHAAAAAAAGADLIGFIFAPARRQVAPETARECIAAARDAAGERRVMAVGVFVDAEPDEINRVVEEAGLDVVQLHGAEPPEMLGELSVPAVKVFRPRSDETIATMLAAADRYLGAARPPAGILFDGYSEKGMGGEGIRADWTLAAEIARVRPIMLGGGLDAENVAAAIARVGPVGVDVSSGVESDGGKDPVRIEAFVAAAREAFKAVGRAAR